MQQRFFKGDVTAEPLKSLYEDWKKQQEIRDKKLDAIFDTMPFYNGWYGSQSSVQGIICNEDNPALEQIRQDKGYKITLFNNGKPSEKTAYVIRPNRRYKSGKVLYEKLCNVYSLLQKYAEFSKFALAKLNMRCWVIDGTNCYIAVCGIFNDTFIASVPVKSEGCGGGEFPTIPDCLTEIKESEFLAIQGK